MFKALRALQTKAGYQLFHNASEIIAVTRETGCIKSVVFRNANGNATTIEYCPGSTIPSIYMEYTDIHKDFRGGQQISESIQKYWSQLDKYVVLYLEDLKKKNLGNKRGGADYKIH